MSTIVIGSARFVCFNFLMRGGGMSKERGVNTRPRIDLWNAYVALLSIPRSIDELVSKVDDVNQLLIDLYKSVAGGAPSSVVNMPVQEIYRGGSMSKSEESNVVIIGHVVTAIKASLDEPQSFEEREEQAAVIQESLKNIGVVIAGEEV